MATWLALEHTLIYFSSIQRDTSFTAKYFTYENSERFQRYDNGFLCLFSETQLDLTIIP